MNGQYVPLFLAVSIPTVVSLIGLLLNRADYNSIRSELTNIREELTAIRERLVSVETRLGFIEGLLGIPKPAAAQKK